MRLWYIGFLLLLAGCFWTSCVTPYEPEILDQGNNYLVVEGHLVSGAPTTIWLSRTSALSNKEVIRPETSASVYIEGQGGMVYTLQETAEGTYTAAELDLNPADLYRLNIKTAAGKQYRSEYVPLQITPPIESLEWQQYSNFNVGITVNTRDTQNSTWYYKWNFEETWMWISPLSPNVDYVNGQLVPMADPPPILCWGASKSRNILIASSARYGSDAISDFRITIIPRNDWKISTKYSILVKQYALSQEAFEYFQQMKKNGETVGSLFDPQPVELRGNLYAVDDPTEPVIGFFTAGTVAEKRIYIENRDLTTWEYFSSCTIKAVPLDSLNYYFKGRLIPYHYDFFEAPSTVYGILERAYICQALLQCYAP